MNAPLGEVLATLAKNPGPFPTTDAAKAAVSGLSPGIAAWLTAGLRRTDGGGFEWGCSPAAGKALYESYLEASYWDLLDSPPCEVHLVQAELSDRWTPALVGRLDEAAALSGRKTARHVLAKAGHWVNADQPKALTQMLASHLARIG